MSARAARARHVVIRSGFPSRELREMKGSVRRDETGTKSLECTDSVVETTVSRRPRVGSAAALPEHHTITIACGSAFASLMAVAGSAARYTIQDQTPRTGNSGESQRPRSKLSGRIARVPHALLRTSGRVTESQRAVDQGPRHTSRSGRSDKRRVTNALCRISSRITRTPASAGARALRQTEGIRRGASPPERSLSRRAGPVQFNRHAV